MGVRRRWIHGFTLIELMLVSAIIGILASIAIPRFGDLIIKAKEAAVKGKLGALRSALNIYYADNDGFIPYDSSSSNFQMTTFLVPKYIHEVPKINFPRGGHTPGNVNSNCCISGQTLLSLAGSPGVIHDGLANLGVAYIFDYNFGTVLLMCTHPTSDGRLWSSF